MPIDRALQLEMLKQMAGVYPRWIAYEISTETEMRKYAANLIYLAEHGLCESGVQITPGGDFRFGSSTITAAGLDFLAEDGGLSAILGVVTVKLHADTIRDLIAAKIEAAPVRAEEKSVLRRHLAGLSEMALREATTDLVKRGLDHLPDAIHWLQTLGGL